MLSSPGTAFLSEGFLIAHDMAVDLKDHGVAVVSIWPNGVVPEPPATVETYRYSGRAVVCLVERARQNAIANGLVAQFEVTDLFAPNLAPYGRFDKLLIDPPRQGAIEIVKMPLAAQRIVYVSCDTATLARDAGVLVHTQGYRLVAAGVVNMFPHTAHVESITLFEKGGSP